MNHGTAPDKNMPPTYRSTLHCLRAKGGVMDGFSRFIANGSFACIFFLYVFCGGSLHLKLLCFVMLTI